jgi:hypothetical protein
MSGSCAIPGCRRVALLAVIDLDAQQLIRSAEFLHLELDQIATRFGVTTETQLQLSSAPRIMYTAV